MEDTMRKASFILLILSLTFLTLTLLADKVDVTGDWEMTTQSPRGERTSTVAFVQEGKKITVTMEGFRGDEITGEGTVKGNQIEWTITRSTPRGDFTITYTGTIEGDTMSGEAQMGDFGSREWSAVRKKD